MPYTSLKASSIAETAARKDVGGILVFGKYMVQAGMKPYDYPIRLYKDMEWFILAREGTKMLLLSRDCIDWDFIDGTSRPQTWENCYVRKELLPAFLSDSFTEQEMSLITPVRVHIEDSLLYGTKGGADTDDFVFLLSTEEFRKYVFPEAAAAPLFQLDQPEISGPERGSRYELFQPDTCWWLRSPGADQSSNAIVNERGELDEAGLDNSADEVGIRPALWIDLALAGVKEDLPF